MIEAVFESERLHYSSTQTEGARYLQQPALSQHKGLTVVHLKQGIMIRMETTDGPHISTNATLMTNISVVGREHKKNRSD